MSTLEDLRHILRNQHRAPEKKVIDALLTESSLSSKERTSISENAAKLVRHIRNVKAPGIMENFLAEYGLSTKEGIALMCLAETLLRVPDTRTIDELIEDKIVPYFWAAHLGKSHSLLVNASSWGLMLSRQNYKG